MTAPGERQEWVCKTTFSRRTQRPLADFAEPPQSKRRNPLRRKSGVFCARSVSAGVVTRCFSPCLIFWCFWIKTKAQEERKCTTEEIDSPERIPTSRSAASYLRAEGRGTRPRWRASAGGDCCALRATMIYYDLTSSILSFSRPRPARSHCENSGSCDVIGASARSDRAKSEVFRDRSASAGVVIRYFSPCLIFWRFWIKPKARKKNFKRR